MTVLERESRSGGLRIFRQPGWQRDFPRLRQGITGRGEARFGLSGTPSGGTDGYVDGFARLRRITGIGRVARCRQVHGSEVRVCGEELTEGVTVLGEADALVTAREGVLLAITVADCVPVFLADPERRVLGLAHAGWRGIAAGVVEATLGQMADLGSVPRELHAHLGPAICGDCYEVGPEVPAALGGWPAGTSHVDLRTQILRGLSAAGVPEGRLSTSDACTRCRSDAFYSYRGGDRDRRMCAFLGWLPR